MRAKKEIKQSCPEHGNNHWISSYAAKQAVLRDLLLDGEVFLQKCPKCGWWLKKEDVK